MVGDENFPPYIHRPEEQVVRDEVEQLREHGASRALLLYGDGGVGKTQMMRELAVASRNSDPGVIWLNPIDLDDSTYWLLSSLEQRVIAEIDPEGHYFGPYLSYLRRLPGHTLERIDRKTVVSHLGAVKQEFVNCYTKLAKETGSSIVVVFDTVEVVRGLSLLYTIAEWMKSLPATLFILSGRPLRNLTEDDPILRELKSGRDGLHVTQLTLDRFDWDSAHDYLAKSNAANNALSDEEKTKLVLLTRGYPLWLAFTITYLAEQGVPTEAATRTLTELEQSMPYAEATTQRGNLWFASYKRRLVTPFGEADFRHEAINRMAVVRQNISQDVWERLMADRADAGSTSLAQEWERLREIPWIRARSSKRYVTLHDAVAEEISQRVIPTIDRNQEWRHHRWRDAARIYADLGDELEANLRQEKQRLDGLLEVLDENSRLRLRGFSDPDPADSLESALIADVEHLDGRMRELDELRTVSLHFELLSDFEKGAKRFLELFRKARQDHDPLPAERLAVEIQRFLPNSVDPPANDAIGRVIRSFQSWLVNAGSDIYLQIVKILSDYQIRNEQPQAASVTIGDLPDQVTDPAMRFELNILKGNALMRIPDESEHAEHYFSAALTEAEAMQSDSAMLLQARAHKEFGFYHRQRGRWRLANDSYAEAFRLISAGLASNNSDEFRKELASIERNWAYVSGISGNSSKATNLIASAIAIYRHYEMTTEEAAAYCVRGEINRYGWQFTLAWRSLAQAEQMFIALKNRAWLGIVYQEQAICLLQAHKKGIELLHAGSPTIEARRLIGQALTICREQNLRAYPSALNRAARIFGADDVDAGLRYAKQGIEWAERLSDGWKWTACLVEYVDLNYRGWIETGTETYRQAIRDIAGQVDGATRDTDFLDLAGKWNLLQGHLKIRDWKLGHDPALLAGARENYSLGFALVAETFMGSSSAFTIGAEFERFSTLFQALPEDVRTEWLSEFRRAWGESELASTVLLARLEELY